MGGRGASSPGAQAGGFEPNREPEPSSLDKNGNYKPAYFKSYRIYRQEEASKIWDSIEGLKTGKAMAFTVKRLGNAGIYDENITVRKQTKRQGGGIEVIGRYVSILSPSRSAEARKTFIGELMP